MNTFCKNKILSIILFFLIGICLVHTVYAIRINHATKQTTILQKGEVLDPVESETDDSQQSFPQKEGEASDPEETESNSLQQNLPESPLIDPFSIVVYNYTELKDALANNNDITTVYLGNNITMTGGITVSSSKANIIIDGTNPLIPGSGPFTLTERSSVAITDTIYINSPNNKDIRIRNMVIVGKNYYGPISVNSAYNVALTYDNISYSGPQLTYNRLGTTRYLNSTINVTTNNGNTALTVEEMGEVKNVVFGGNVTINTSSTTNSMLWFLGVGCKLDVLSGANVNINVLNSYMIFSNGGQVACTVGQGATLKISSKYGLFYNSEVLFHQFGNFTIEEDATVDIYQSVRNAFDIATSTIKIKNRLTVNPGAKLYICADYASATPLIRFTAAGMGATFIDPETVLLSNTNGKLFDWSTGSGSINIYASVVDYWTSTAKLSQLSNFSRMPQYYWSKANGENISITASVSSTSTINVTSNFVTGVDAGTAPSASTLNFITARMLSFGRLPVWINQPTVDTDIITGLSASGADRKIDYSTASTSGTVTDIANPTGELSIAIPAGDPLKVGSILAITVHNDYKIKTVRHEVLESKSKILAFQYIPEYLTFKSSIHTSTQLYPRQKLNWSLTIIDTREEGMPWAIYASMQQPLTSTDDKKIILPNAIIFIDENSNKHVLDNNSIRIFSGVKGPYDDTVLSWEEDKGIFLEVPHGHAYVNTRYTAKIQWTLADVP